MNKIEELRAALADAERRLVAASILLDKAQAAHKSAFEDVQNLKDDLLAEHERPT